MRKIILLFAMMLATVFAFAADKPTIKVGAILTLSGDMQLYGGQLRDGILMRLEEQEKAPGIFDYKLDVEDDSLTATKAVLAYKRLVGLNKVDVILLNWSGLSNAVAPLAAQDKKLGMYVSWDKTVAKGDLNFINCTQPESQAELLLLTIKQLRSQKVAVICQVQQGFIATKDQLESKLKSFGIDYKTVMYNPDERDFRAHVLKFYDYAPDLWVVLGFNPGFEIAIRRIKESGSQAPITAVEGYSYAENLSLYNGAFFVEGNMHTPEFSKRFQAYKGKEAEGYNALGYEMMALTIQAYEAAGQKLGRVPTTTEAAQELSKMYNHAGAMGTLSLKDRIFQAPAVLKFIKNGKAEPISLEELVKIYKK